MKTLDIDWKRINGIVMPPDIRHVLQKISSCPYLSELYYRESPSSNGYHIMFSCRDGCEICQLVFDDPKRAYDFRSNYLFDKKPYRKGGNEIILSAGGWIKVEPHGGDRR
jgi:hypothetical protein